jgi:hypothetical protein
MLITTKINVLHIYRIRENLFSFVGDDAVLMLDDLQTFPRTQSPPSSGKSKQDLKGDDRFTEMSLNQLTKKVIYLSG